METKYPTLRRPKRKLCYITDKESPPKHSGGALTLEEEVERMFDDMESCAPLHPPSPLLQSSDSDISPGQTQISPVPLQNCPPENHPEHQTGDKGDVLHATKGSLSPKLDIDFDIPFKAHGPVKTSSPIEHNMGVDGIAEQDGEKGKAVLPNLFNCADEVAKEPQKDPLPTQEPHCNGVVSEEGDGDELESPPSKVTITKTSSHKVKGKALCRQENVETPVQAESRDSEKNSESFPKQPPAETSTRPGKDLTAFLEKLKLAAKSQSTCYKKSPVKVPPPPLAPEVEDDFFILEDDAPLWVSIPSKSTSNKRQKLSKTSSTDKESSTENGVKNNPPESLQEQLEPVKSNAEQESLAVNEKMKKKRKGNEKHHEVMGLVNDEDALPSPQDSPASDSMELQKPQKKKQKLKKVPSKETEKLEDQPEDVLDVEKGKEKPSLGTKTKAHKSLARKNSKEGKENVKTSKAYTLKETRKNQQESDAGKEVPRVDLVEEQCPEPADAENLASFSDKELTKSEADKKTTANKHPTRSGGSLPEDAEDLGKRQRKQTGQWWLSCLQNTVETEGWQPTPKKSKQQSKESKAAVLSPVKAKKDKVYKKKTNQKPPVQLSSEQTGKEKKSKQTKKRNMRGDTGDMKAADEILITNEAEQEQQEIQDQDLDHQHSSPLVFTHRDYSTDSDKEVIKSKTDKRTTANKHPGGSGGSLFEDADDFVKRKRKQTGQQWLSCPQNTVETEGWQPTPKKSKQQSKESKAAVLSPVKATKDKVYKKKTNQKPPVQLSSEQTGKEKKSKQTKKRNMRGDTGDMKAADEILITNEAEQEQQEIQDQDLDHQHSSPLVFTHRDYCTDSGCQLFQKVYHHNTKLAAPGSPRQPQQQLKPESGKRRRRPPGNWWTVNNMADDLESIPSQPPQLYPKEPKHQQERKKSSKQRKPAGLGVPKNGNVVIPSKPPGGALTPPLKPLSAPKTVKRSLATFNDIFTSRMVTPIVVSNRDGHQSNRCSITSHPAEEVSATDFVTCSRADKDVLSGDAGGCRNTQINQETPQDKECHSESTLEVLKSGPSSMIQLEQYEDDDDLILPSSTVQGMLAVSDLSATPLKPLSLHPSDKAALSQWFQSLWSPSADDGAAVTPDQFDWYSYKDRALGIQADLNSGSICSGKILLGSYMKKPLWVDHSATTVFHLLTSSVSVTINGSVSRYLPGQTFKVECGSAYSIHNSSAQPAVLFFTRILVESSD